MPSSMAQRDPPDVVIGTQIRSKYSESNSKTRDATRSTPKLGDTQYQIDIEREIQHICKITLDDRLFLAPLSDLKRAVDIGSGCGFWTIEMAQSHPTAEIWGLDMLPPPPGSQPNNANFIVSDCCKTWPYPSDHFDLVYIRNLSGSIADWNSVYLHALKHLRPGGFLEHIEWSNHIRSSDGKLSKDPMFSQWTNNVVHASRVLGKTHEICENMAGLIEEAGFVDTTQKIFKWPIGNWSGNAKMNEIGQRTLTNWQQALATWAKSVPAESSEMTRKELDDWVLRAQEALRNPGQEIYHEVRVVYARKP